MKQLKIMACLLIFSGLALGCPQAGDIVKQTIKEPKVNVKSVKITDISMQDIALVLDLEIDNPNPIGLSLAGLEYNLALADATLAQGQSSDKLSIAAQGLSPAAVPVKVSYKDLEAIYNAYGKEDYIPYKLTGKVKLDTPIGVIPIPYTAKGEMPVIRVPKITSFDISFKSLSLSGIDATMKIGLDNPNVFDLNIGKLDYLVKLEDNDFASGALGAQKVKSKASGTLKIPVKLDFTAVGGWLTTLVNKGKANYSLAYDADYDILGDRVKQKELIAGKVEF